MMDQEVQWVALDWGTTRLRAWAMGVDGVIEARSSDTGMGGLSPDQFEHVLLSLIGDWLSDAPMPIIACGMVGARQGWIEAAYRAVPCRPLGLPMARPVAQDPRLRIRIVPGLSQTDPTADVMRGEETQIAGVLALNADWDGVVCLPGTHSKWAEVSAGEVVSFRSFMTGELFALLSEHSVLRHGLQAGDDAVFDDATFTAAVTQVVARPEALAGRLFTLRAENLLADLSPCAARARLSGLLIGAELAASKPWWLGRDIVIVGAGDLAELYAKALATQGVTARLFAGDDAALAGRGRKATGEPNEPSTDHRHSARFDPAGCRRRGRGFGSGRCHHHRSAAELA